MPKSLHALARLGVGATAVLALVFGGLAAPAFADDVTEPPTTPTSESDGADAGQDAGEENDADTGDAEDGGELLFGVLSEDPDPVAEPTVSVSPATGLDRAGQDVTISGTGYSGSPIYVIVCEDRDLADVSFAMLTSGTCLPSSTAKQVTKTPSSGTQIRMAEDGSFSFTYAVPAAAAELEHPTVFTLRNHTGMSDRTQDAKFSIEFAPVPTLSVSPATGLSRAGQDVTVSGTGYSGEPIYVIVCEDQPLSEVSFAMLSSGSCLSASTAKQVTKAPTTETQIRMQDDGSFSFTYPVPAAAAEFEHPTVFTLRNHTGMGDRTQDAKFSIAFTPVPTVSVSPATALDRAGQDVTVSGTGYSGSPIYVIVCEDRPLSEVSFAMLSSGDCLSASTAKQVTKTPTTDTQIRMAEDGSFSFTYSVPAAAADFEHPTVFTLRNHTGMSDRTQDAKFAIAFAAVGGGGTPDPGPVPAGPSDPGSVAPRPTTSVSPSTINPTVANSITVSGSGFAGAAAAQGVYVSLGAASVWQPGAVPDASTFVTTVWVEPTRLSGGSFSTTLTIPAGALSLGTSYGVATFAAHNLAITDRSLDTWTPLTLSTGAAATVTAAVRTPAPTPPTTAGATVDRPQASSGGPVTITAGGFQPNETGIMVVIYSDPVVLATNATADADGVVTWTGYLPAGLTGSHTLTLQGSISAGVPIVITPRSTIVGECTIEAAELVWGFKESFRAYLSGTVAHGDWSVADGAAYDTPVFSWQGEGAVDEALENGELGFGGSIRFTGHGGTLDTTVASPRLVLAAGAAKLLLDVYGSTQAGQHVSETAVEFAELDLAAATVETVGGRLVIRDIPATLTPAGSAAFGTYEAGEALDPITLSMALPDGCGVAMDLAAGSEVRTVAGGGDTGADLSWVWWVAGAAGLLAILVTIAVVVARRRSA